MTTLKVEILGTGCKKCQQLEANAKEAIAHRQLEAEIAHITNTMEIVKQAKAAQYPLLPALCPGSALCHPPPMLAFSSHHA